MCSAHAASSDSAAIPPERFRLVAAVRVRADGAALSVLAETPHGLRSIPRASQLGSPPPTLADVISQSEVTLNVGLIGAEPQSWPDELVSVALAECDCADPLWATASTPLLGVGLLRELSARTHDRVVSYGERMSDRMMAAHLNNVGVSAVARSRRGIWACAGAAPAV